MKTDDSCPKKVACPLFRGEMLASQKAQEIYVSLFCNGGESGRMECKRFLLTLEGVKPDIELMPNDSRTVEEIINDMKK